MPKPIGFDQSGCWVRILRRPPEEIKFLAIREDLKWNELLGHDNQGDIDYTPHSSCTYIREGIRISLFSGGVDDEFGVFIRPFNRPTDWWYNGRREVVTDDIKPEPGKLYDNGEPKSDQRWSCSITDIEQGILALQSEYAADSYYKENAGELVSLNWNEAFLRYQRKDITGILINESSKKSVFFALSFRKALGLDAHLYSYDSTKGVCSYLNSDDLCKKHGINTQSESFTRLIADYSALYIKHYEQILKVRSKEAASLTV